MSAPPVISDLVERFEQQGDAYKSGQYNEAQLRKEFIDPMFKALGWDMENVSGYAEAYKDVIHEDAIKIGGATKAPDYCFRIGGTRKFFLEAKKPSVDIKTDAQPAYQLRRYAWSAKLPLSILTDFEEFAVYDCRVEPKLTDKASVARVLYLNFEEYVSSWEDIEKIFARDAILKGSFDKFAESTKANRGTAEVDDAFLTEIEKWRAELARNLALRNPKLSQRDLNFSVQRTIDRIVFLRICEDRRVEVYGRLQALLNGEHTYRRLYQLFREADQRYNSGLFYFQQERDRVEPPDDLTPELEIDDAVLKKIIRRLYYPDSPYEFSVLPADILGQVYEQFLGKVIRLTEGHQAKVEDKPEVKKAGGVYYTPTYIVDYIVENTVGKLLENKTPKQAAKLRIVDPACGSGSFLIAAYQYLLNWHRDWYVADDTRKWTTGRNPVLYQGPGGEWKLTTGERKRILLQNIFGVDIDAQAVEVTKLSLLLKVLEGESEQTLATQLRFYHERALPDLGRNIKCGNSLIGQDFYQQTELRFPDEEERYRINAFDWGGKDGFPETMKAGGFDAVIGNPPWVFTRDVDFGQLAKDYFASHSVGGGGKVNLYALFLDKGTEILRKDGLLSMILPNTFLRAATYEKLRRHLITKHRLVAVTDAGTDVFRGVTASSVVLLIQKNAKASSVAVFSIPKDGVAHKINTVEIKQITETPSAVVDIFTDTSSRQIMMKMAEHARPLAEFVEHLISGIQTWKQHKSNFISNRKLSVKYKPLLEGKDIGRYESHFANKYIFYSAKVLNVMQDENIFLLPDKIVIQRISGGTRPLKATLDEKRRYCFNSVNTLVCHSVANQYVLGLLNSTLLSWYYYNRFSNRSELTVNIATKLLRQLPIPAVNLSNAIDKARYNRMVQLVERMLALHKQLPDANTGHAKTSIQRQIDATDAEIDKLVYELYELTPDEIKIVEAAT
jgi:type I restriction-modification system DNA methylase subunit